MRGRPAAPVSLPRRRWALSLSLVNALFDPTGVFRPAEGTGREGCAGPEAVRRDYEVVLPAVPSVGMRVEF